jgi:poly[(R)-3-hydroxyalkanoate] polymerase subunit PhaE
MVNSKDKASTGGRSMFEAWTSGMKSWETLHNAFTMPETLETALKSIQPSPESVLKMAETGWKSFQGLMGDWQKQLHNMGKNPDTLMFPNLYQDALTSWSELYDKEFRKFLNVPQLGLARFHQEKINHSLDAFVRFQNTMAEFLYLLYKPIEKSGNELQKEISNLVQNDEPAKEPKEYYGIWLKVLEKNYMVLFKTDEYLQLLGKTMSAMEEYHSARKEVIDSLLQTFSIPTTKDMDDVYKDMYFLKKRVHQLEKQLKNMMGERKGKRKKT